MEADPQRLERALLAAHNAMVSLLEKRLPGSSSFFSVVMKLVRDSDEFVLVIDVYARRRNTRGLEDILEEAVDEARRVFEVEAGIRAGKKIRVRRERGKEGCDFSPSEC